jgi:hypothetical protein
LNLDEYKGPITKSKRKKLCILISGKHIPETSPDMVERNKQLQEEPRRETHEERQGGVGGGGRNQENLRFKS